MEKLGSTDPQRIGGYRLLGRLGSGGMGSVFLARSDRGRTVALKLVRPDLAERQEFRDRFRQEVRAARQVGSAWTAPVLDADTEAPVPWVATGYVAGPSLHATVSGRTGAYGPLPERSVRGLGAGLTHALEAIHSAGLIHRDLKPSNILLTIDGPRVIDFGIARALDTLPDAGLTRTGALIGSPGFMAPEQVRGERVTTACDVFCLGAVLAYASTGRLPFGGGDNEAHALMFRIAQEEPDLTGVPVDLVDLVRDCLRKDPGARPTTDELLDRLAEDDTDEPWLPGALIAQLGRHAVELLDAENPEDEPPSTPTAPEAPAAPAAPVASPAPAASTAPPPVHGYGYPPPVHGYGYGYPQDAPAYGYPPASPHHQQQPPAPEPSQRGKGSTIALVVTALIVAVGAGGSVYTLMQDSGGKADPRPTHSTSPGGPSPSAAKDGTNGDGTIPADYIGRWSGGIDNASGRSTRELTIHQGQVGDTVLTLTAEGPLDTGGSYRCVFEAELLAEPSPEGPVSVGPSTVTDGEPMSSCSAGKASTLTLFPNGTLSRANTETGESLVYTKSR